MKCTHEHVNSQSPISCELEAKHDNILLVTHSYLVPMVKVKYARCSAIPNDLS